MPSVITDPVAYARALKARQTLAQQGPSPLIDQGNAGFVDPMTGVPYAQPDNFLQPSAPVSAPVKPAIPTTQISPAQIAGGSGMYMSNAPSQSDMTAGGATPDAQVAGGSGDYMSKVQSPDVAASGASPAQDTGMFSFFGKPEATDALTAFGAGMLRGRNFNDGLANAAEGVNTVAKQYRPYTQDEIDRLMQKAEIERLAKARMIGRQVNFDRPIYGNIEGGSRELFYPINMPDGSSAFSRASDGKVYPSIQNARRAEDDEAKYDSKNIAAAKEQYMKDAVDNATASGKYDSIVADFEKAGGGAGVLKEAARNLSEKTGLNFLGVDVTKKQEVDTFLRNLELTQAGSQRGLGQLTEAEREIIRSSLPSLSNSPEAFKNLVMALKARSDRAAMMFDKWSNDPELQSKYRDPRSYFVNWIKSDEGKQYEANLKSQIASKTGNTSVNSGKTSSGLNWSIEQ